MRSSNMTNVLRMLLCGLVLLSLQVLCHTTHALDTDDRCVVTQIQDLTPSLNTTTLAFITTEHLLDIIVSFRGLDNVYHRDAVIVSNYAATHYRVREGRSSNTSHPLPLGLPEGWKTLRLSADDRNLSLEWINKNDSVTLLSLTLDFTAETVSLKGFFSVCSGVSPEWDVGDGQRVTVLLQPLESEQQLVVTGQGSTRPYLVNSNGPPLQVLANTTLKMKTRRQGLHSTIDIPQENQDQVQMVESLRPVVVVGNRGGNVRLTLKLSGLDDEKEDSCKQDLQILSSNTEFIVIIIAFLLGTLVTFIIATIALARLLWKEKKKRQDSSTNDWENSGRQTVAVVIPPWQPGSSKEYNKDSLLSDREEGSEKRLIRA